MVIGTWNSNIWFYPCFTVKRMLFENATWSFETVWPVVLFCQCLVLYWFAKVSGVVKLTTYLGDKAWVFDSGGLASCTLTSSSNCVELRSNDDNITFHIINRLPSSIWSPCTWSSAPVRLWPCPQPQTTRTSSVLSSRWRAPAQSWWGKWCQKILGQNAVKILVSSHSATIAINVKEIPTLLW